MVTAVAMVVLAGQFGGSAVDNALVDGDKVHLFLPPVVVSEGRLHGCAWSDDGRYLLVLTEAATIPPQEVRKYFETGKTSSATPTLKLDVFNSATGTVKTLWRAENTSGVGAPIFYFKNSDVAVASVHVQGEVRLLRITCGTSRVEALEVIQGQPTQNPTILPDPLGRYIASQTYEPPTVRFITPSGKLGPRRPWPIPNSGMWTAQGEYLVARTREEFYSVNPDTGETAIVSGKPNFQPLTEPEMPFRTRASNLPIPGRKEPIKVVIASLGEHSIGVAFDAQSDVTSKGGVFFRSGFINMVRPVVQISKEAFDEVVAREQRAEIMQKLSKIGKALMMYGADNDDTFPTSEELDAGAISGYLGESGLLDGFIYSGNTSYGSSPAQTEFGYMLCPGGKAVVYQDGHVKFVPDR